MDAIIKVLAAALIIAFEWALSRYMQARLPRLLGHLIDTLRLAIL